jgi:hypothetical protein
MAQDFAIDVENQSRHRPPLKVPLVGTARPGEL